MNQALEIRKQQNSTVFIIYSIDIPEFYTESVQTLEVNKHDFAVLMGKEKKNAGKKNISASNLNATLGLFWIVPHHFPIALWKEENLLKASL